MGPETKASLESVSKWELVRAAVWRELENAERAWLGGTGSAASGRTGFDSRGLRIGLTQMPLLGGLLGRTQRLRNALDLSMTRTRELLQRRFAAVDIGSIWPILQSLLHDIALYVGGGAVGGAAVGGALGALAGGVGAVPGAAGGATLGASTGLWALNVIGLASMAKDLAEILPKALDHYVCGCSMAWGAPPQDRTGPGRGAQAIGPNRQEPGATLAAADEIAKGHVLLATALLLALMAWVTRGKGDRAAVLKEIRESRRLGPKVATWVEAQEGKFGHQMAMIQRETAGGGTAKPAPTPRERPAAPARAAREVRQETPAAKAQQPTAAQPRGEVPRTRTADEVNDTYPAGYQPPYKPGTQVQEFRTQTDQVFARVHGAGNQARSWMMRPEDIQGLTAEQIKSKFALPELPSLVSDVHVPAGTTVRTGIVNPIFGGTGNATQFELLNRLPSSAFQNMRPLGGGG